MLFSSTMMAGPLTSSPAPLPNEKYVLVVSVHYQDSKDKSSTANLKHHVVPVHALHCFGEDAVNDVIAGKEHSNSSRGILALFTRKGKQPVKYSHRVHTNPEVRVCHSTLYWYMNTNHW